MMIEFASLAQGPSGTSVAAPKWPVRQMRAAGARAAGRGLWGACAVSLRRPLVSNATKAPTPKGAGHTDPRFDYSNQANGAGISNCASRTDSEYALYDHVKARDRCVGSGNSHVPQRSETRESHG